MPPTAQTAAADTTTLVCLFKHYREAVGSIDELKQVGFSKSTISLIGDGNIGPMCLYPDDVLTSLMIPPRNLRQLERGLERGGVIVALSVAQEHVPLVERIFLSHKAHQIADEVISHA